MKIGRWARFTGEWNLVDSRRSGEQVWQGYERRSDFERF